MTIQPWANGIKPSSWTGLPHDAWAAILDYLEASGRLAGMRPGDYIFAPRAEPGSLSDNTRAVDWASGRCVAPGTFLSNLKVYGRAAGISEELLNFETLRYTAIRLQLDAGATTKQMQVFLDTQAEQSLTSYRLRQLPPIPEDQVFDLPADAEIQVPNRLPHHFELIHGYYAQGQPQEQVLAVLAQDIQGIEEQIVGLRTLARGLVERQIAARGGKEVAQLADAHSKAVSRLAEMIDIERQPAGDGQGDSWANDVLATIDQIAIQRGAKPGSQGIRAAALGDEADLEITTRLLVEEIAAARYMLREVLALALETQAVPGYVHLVEIYRSGCVRLVRMLKKQRSDQDRLQRCLQELIATALQEVLREWGRV